MTQESRRKRLHASIHRRLCLELLEPRLLLNGVIEPQVVGPDWAEPNGTLETAYDLGVIQGRQEFKNLSVHGESDEDDWFEFQTVATGTPAHYVEILFSDASGDLDLRFYDRNGDRIDSSMGLSDNERVSLDGHPAGTYYARVDWWDMPNPRYDLEIMAPQMDLSGEFFRSTLPESVVAGERVGGTVWVDVANMGDAPLPQGQRIEIDFTAANLVGGADVDLPDLSNVLVSGLKAGQTRRFARTVSLSDGLSEGEYEIRAQIVGRDLEESDLANNTVRVDADGQPVEIVSDQPFVDLEPTVLRANLPDETVSGAGQRMTVVTRVSNNGNVAVERGATMDLAVAARPARAGDDSRDVVLRTLNRTEGLPVSGLPAGGSRNYTAVFELPPGMASDQYEILVFADAGDDIAESDESNNWAAAGQVDVTKGHVDLSGTFFRSTLPPSVVVGERVAGTVWVDVTNQGNVPLPQGQRIDIEFTAFNTPTNGAGGGDSDLPDLRNVPVSGLKPGQTRRFVLPVMLADGLTEGAYRIVGQIVPGGGLAESNPDNNAISRDAEGRFSSIYSAPPFVDLVPDPIELPYSILPGERLFANVNVANRGNVRAFGTMDIEIRASEDAAWDPAADSLLASLRNVKVAINPGASRAYRVPVVVPSGLAAGHYRILAFVDPGNAIAESHEANNFAVSVQGSSVAWRFGTWGDQMNGSPGRRNVVLRVEDPNGTTVQFRMAGDGYGEIEGMNDFTSISLFDTTDRSQFLIQPLGDRTQIGSVFVVDGSLGGIVAPKVDFTGHVVAQEGAIYNLRLGDMLGEYDENADLKLGMNVLAIGGEPDGRPAAMRFGQVNYMILTTTLPIGSLQALEWRGGGLRASSLNSIRVTGSRPLGVAGDLGAYVLLGVQPGEPYWGAGGFSVDERFFPDEDYAPPTWTLNNAKIAGAVGGQGGPNNSWSLRDDYPEWIPQFGPQPIPEWFPEGDTQWLLEEFSQWIVVDGGINRFDAGSADSVAILTNTGLNSLNLNAVADTLVVSGGPVGSVTARNWEGGGVFAESLANLRVIGHPRVPGAEGNFNGNLWLTGRDWLPGDRALGNATATGNMDEGDWLLFSGGAGTIQANRFGDNWRACIEGGVERLGARGDFNGAIEAGSFNLLDVGGNLEGAGVWGHEPTALGQRSAYTIRNVRVKEAVRDSQIFSAGNIFSFTANEMFGSHLLAGVGEGLQGGIDAEIGTLQIRGSGETFGNTYVGAAAVQKVVLSEVVTQNENRFGVFFSEGGHTWTRYAGRVYHARDIQNGTLIEDGRFFVGVGRNPT